MALLPPGTETAGGKYEDLLCDCVDFPHAFVIVHNWYTSLSDPQWDWPGFTHVTVAGNCAFLAGCLTSPPCREAHQTHALLQVSLPVQLQQGDVVVQGLAVVVVVDVGGRHPQSLCTWGSKLLCEVVVPHPDIDSVTSTYNICNTVGGSQYPLGTYESSPTQVLVEGVDESNLPAPLTGYCVLPPHHPPTTVGTLHPTHVLVGHHVAGGSLLHMVLLGGEGVVCLDELRVISPNCKLWIPWVFH